MERLSILSQAALALAVAERRLSFEHRDLHWGNVLIHEAAGDGGLPPNSVLDGVTYQPCGGPRVSIVDFTLSRMTHRAFPESGRVLYQRLDFFLLLQSVNLFTWTSPLTKSYSLATGILSLRSTVK